jgi:hypothetical protein
MSETMGMRQTDPNVQVEIGGDQPGPSNYVAMPTAGAATIATPVTPTPRPILGTPPVPEPSVVVSPDPTHWVEIAPGLEVEVYDFLPAYRLLALARAQSLIKKARGDLKGEANAAVVNEMFNTLEGALVNFDAFSEWAEDRANKVSMTMIMDAFTKVVEGYGDGGSSGK